jgi:hypothetical protein
VTVSASVAAPVGGATEAKQDQQIALWSRTADYAPGYGPQNLGGGGLRQDPDGQLLARSLGLTDEGTFRVNFANASIALPIGTVSAISGATVTGSGFASLDTHAGDYFKLDADPQTSWMQIDSILSDTQLLLVAPYVGAASGAASRALMAPAIGTGGALAVASGVCTIGSGTSISSTTQLRRDIDYAPLIFRSAFSISQRIANQATLAGLEDIASTVKWFARFRFDGTVNTTVICETGRNPSVAPTGAEIQSTTVTLPPGLNTSQSIEYRIEVLTERVVFYIGGRLVAEHTRVIPSQHDELTARVGITNNASFAGTNTNVVLDYVTCKNHNKLEVGVMSENEQIVASQAPATAFGFTAPGIVNINTDLIQLDCLQLRSLSIHATALGTTGVITLQWSNDPAFGTIVAASVVNANTGAETATITAVGLYTTPVHAQYCRIRMTTATTAGATTLLVRGFQLPIGIMPVRQQGNVSASLAAGTNSIGTVQPGNTANTTPWLAQGNILQNADYTSAAVATSGAEATITQGVYGSVAFLFTFSAGTGAGSMDFVFQESLDGGTTWIDRWAMPRISGASPAPITTPQFNLTGNRYRWNRTLTGTYSITRVATAMRYPDVMGQWVRSFYDRAVVPATLNSTTASWPVLDVLTHTFTVVMAGGGAPPTFTVQVSQDNVNWANTANTIVAAVGAATSLTVNLASPFARLIVSVAGAGSTLTYASVYSSR